MKALAEFSTVSGIALGLYLPSRLRRVVSLVVGVATRIAVMSAMNLIGLPNYYGMPYNVAVGLLPMLAVFNALQGAMMVFIGNLLYEAYIRRFPTKFSGLQK